ncbi:MAG: pilus assembly protein PilM [Limisphaera sp.]|nr:pilus assembly protein PilM [Limisphaera sp.]
MALAFFRPRSQRRDEVVAVDLGARCSKAVWVQTRPDGLALLRYAILDAPVAEKEPSTAALAEHLRSLLQALETRCRLVSLALGVNDAIVRYAELPQMPLADMRQVLKTSSKLYLQQELPGYVFDCWPVNGAERAPADKTKTSTVPKQKVLVAGARQSWVDTLYEALKQAGCTAGNVLPGLVAPINALESAQPELFRQEVVALVNLGFRHSSICILQQGELVLSRVLGMGGDHVTQGLANMMGISYAEAEGIKLGMPGEVREQLQSLLAPLARELKASIDFYEHQNDRPVSQVLVSGGSALSDCVLQLLQAELVTDCRPWDPTAGLQRSLPPQQLAELEQLAPHLTVAIGTALATL